MRVGHAIGDDIGCGRDNQFARAGDLAGAADEGIGREQPVRSVVDFVDDAGRAPGASLGDIIADGFELA